MGDNMRVKQFKKEYMYNLGKNTDGQRLYMTGADILERYHGSKPMGLNLQQSGKLRKIARQIIGK
jgi:hypothetical protein